MEKIKYEEIHKENAEEICRKIKEDAAREIKEILERAKKAAATTLEEAKRIADNRKLELLKEFEKELQVLKEKFSSGINLEKKRLILEEKSKLIEGVLENVKKEAESFRSNKDYRNFLKKAILEGIDVIDAQNITVNFSFLDERIFSPDFIHEIESAARSRGHKNCFLQIKKCDFKDIGAILESSDHHLIYDNRFLARLGRVYEDVYMKLLKESF